jgi:hypothetical protein
MCPELSRFAPVDIFMRLLCLEKVEKGSYKGILFTQKEQLDEFKAFINIYL